jgi:hypothetical protein
MNLQEEHDIKTLVNVLPFDLKLYLIEKLTSKSIVYSSNKIVNFVNNHVNSVYEYLLLKSFSFLCLTRNNDYFIKILKDFDFKPVTFYIYNFINSKINAFIKTFHGSQKKSFSLAVLKGSSLHTKSFKFKANTLAKIYFSYKY